MIFLTIVFMALALFSFIGICICIAEADIFGVFFSLFLLFGSLQLLDDACPWKLVDSKEIPYERVIVTPIDKSVSVLLGGKYLNSFTSWDDVSTITSQNYTVIMRTYHRNTILKWNDQILSRYEIYDFNGRRMAYTFTF